MSADRPTVFFHIGSPKTGTTYLQQRLFHNRPALRRSGLLYPGTQHAHFWEAQDLRGSRFKGHSDRHVPGAWDRLVGEIRRWGGTALIDHESFSGASEAAVDRALSALSFADVHLVLTARDLARQLPASWQERIKNGSTRSYHDFLTSMRASRATRSASARQFWSYQSAPDILSRWARDVPADHVHVITVPPPGSDPELLWQRFAGLLDLEPDAYEPAPRGANTSLGAAEAAVLRRINTQISEAELPWPVYAAAFKHFLAPALAQREGAAIELPEKHYAWTVSWSRRAVAQLQRAGYDVVGDLDELIPRSRPTGLDPDTAPGEAQADAAVAGAVSLVAFAASGTTARSALRRSQRGPLLRKIEEIVARVPRLSALRDAYRGR